MPRKDLESYSAKIGYKKKIGMVMFYLHRITGIILGIFFILHLLAQGGYFSSFSKLTSWDPFKLFLILVISFHTLNGLRIIVMEFFNGAEKEVFSKQAVIVIILTIIIFIIGIFTI